MRILKLAEPEKTKHIGITGGEPTLAKNQLIQILKYCRDNYPDTTISLLSNGKKFNSFEFTKQIAEINHPKLVYCISLCSDTDSEHDRLVGAKGSFYETISGLHNLALFKQKIELRTVIHKLNYKRLIQLSEFYYRNFPFVIHIAFMGMEVIGLCLENINELWIDPLECRKILREAVLQGYRRLMHVSIYNIPLCLIHEDVWSFSRQSISPWKNVYLPICDDCIVKDNCCGIFSTSGLWQSENIRPISK
jgi:His-Xaa-Ser system radical SAM maturase HxsC